MILFSVFRLKNHWQNTSAPRFTLPIIFTQNPLTQKRPPKTDGLFTSFQPDLNRRPLHYEWSALPTALWKHINIIFSKSKRRCVPAQKPSIETTKLLLMQQLCRMTWPGIEPGFTPWEGVVLAAWPSGPKNRGDVIRTRGLCVPNAALYQTEPRFDCCSSSAIFIISDNHFFVNT